MKDNNNNNDDDDIEEVVADLVSAIQRGDYYSVEEVFNCCRSNSNSHSNSNSNAAVTASLPVTVMDRDGCSLLQWAAINNRKDIATLLLSLDTSKQLINSCGGILKENSLQWSLRKQHYDMMDLLIQQNINIHHKNIQGCDSLHIAVRNGDLLGVFLLLYSGSDPNSVDEFKDTPMMWLIKHRLDQPLTLDITRLLIKFGANLFLQDETTGNTVLHLLAVNMVTKSDMQLPTLIHMRGGVELSQIRNKDHLTAYSVAMINDNRKFARFLIDMVCFQSMNQSNPKVTALISYLSILSCVYLILNFGLVYGLIVWFIVYTFIWKNISQWSIVPCRGYLLHGFLYGIITAYTIDFYCYLNPFLSGPTRVFLISYSVLITGLIIKLVNSTPQHIPPVDKLSLLQQIVTASSNNQALIDSVVSVNDQSHSNENATKSDTGLSEVDPLILSKSLPRLCTSCMVNKKLATTHCKYCNRCVIGLNFHHHVLNTCIGKGNRRLYFVFVVLLTLFCGVYWYVSFSIHHQVFCPKSNGILWSLLAVEYCVLKLNPLSSIHLCLTIFLFVYSMCQIRMECLLLAYETTYFNAMRGRFDLKNRISCGRFYQIMNNFLTYGNFNIRYPKPKDTLSSIVIASSSTIRSADLNSSDVPLLSKGEVKSCKNDKCKECSTDHMLDHEETSLLNDDNEFISDDENEFEAPPHAINYSDVDEEEHSHEHRHGHEHEVERKVGVKHTFSMTINAMERL